MNDEKPTKVIADIKGQLTRIRGLHSNAAQTAGQQLDVMRDLETRWAQTPGHEGEAWFTSGVEWFRALRSTLGNIEVATHDATAALMATGGASSLMVSASTAVAVVAAPPAATDTGPPLPVGVVRELRVGGLRGIDATAAESYEQAFKAYYRDEYPSCLERLRQCLDVVIHTLAPSERLPADCEMSDRSQPTRGARLRYVITSRVSGPTEQDLYLKSVRHWLDTHRATQKLHAHDSAAVTREYARTTLLQGDGMLSSLIELSARPLIPPPSA